MATAGANSSPRYHSLDSYRFIAASLIVLFHYQADFGNGFEASPPVVRGLPVMVDFFFVLSGFVIAVTYGATMKNVRDFGRFLQRRVARLFPLHLATLAGFVGLALENRFGWLHANHAQMFDLDALPATIVLLQAWGLVDHLSFNAASWSISAEWLAYLLFPVLFLLSRRLSLAANFAVLIGTIALLTIWRNAMGMRPWYEASYDYGALRALPTFFLGVLLAGLVETSSRTIRVSWPAVHMVFLAAVATLYFEVRELSIALLALVVLLAAIAERGNGPSLMTSRFMTRLGDASYAIYLIQGLVALPILFVLRAHDALGTRLSACAAVATYIAVVVASCFVFSCFETPMRRWISALGTCSRIEKAAVAGALGFAEPARTAP